MKIGIIHYAAPPVVGGVELTIYHHARVLTALGHEVTIVAGVGEAVLPGVIFHHEPLAGSRDERILAIGQALAQGQIPATFEPLVKETETALLRHFAECEVIIGHNMFTLHKNLVLTTAIHRLTQARQGPPWIAWHHDFAWLRPQYQAELHAGEPWSLMKEAWPNVRHVTVSHAQRTDLASLYQQPLESINVIPPGVEPTSFYRLPETVGKLVEQWQLFESEAIFLLPARITRRKNIELALEWLAAVRAHTGWDARLVITGPPGPHNPSNAAYLNQLLKQRDTLQLDNAVHFVYQANSHSNTPHLLDDAEMAAFYQVADAMLFSSRQEGFGIPILEAGLAKLPIFATDLPPFRESGSTFCHLFPLDTPPPKVAQTIAEVLRKDDAFRLRQRVLKQFTWLGVMKHRIVPLLMESLKGATYVEDEKS